MKSKKEGEDEKDEPVLKAKPLLRPARMPSLLRKMKPEEARSQSLDIFLGGLTQQPKTEEKPKTEDERLSSAIDAALKKIEAQRLEARDYDEEIARLGKESSRLIAEMLRDLNLKAA